MVFLLIHNLGLIELIFMHSAQEQVEKMCVTTAEDGDIDLVKAQAKVSGISEAVRPFTHCMLHMRY